MKRLIVRSLIIAAVLAAVLIGIVVVLDLFGSQPQPFQYLLH